MSRRIFAQMMRFDYQLRCFFEDGTEQELQSYCRAVRSGYLGRRIRCRCTTVFGFRCLDNECILRNHFICCPQNCGPNCMNHMFDGPWGVRDLQLQPMDGFGTCTVTTVWIPENTWVIEYVGMVKRGIPQSKQPFAYPISRSDSDAVNVKLGQLYIDCLKTGNRSRCIQHSITPNCEIQQWINEDRIRLVVVSLRDIEMDEILTLSYPQFRDESSSLSGSEVASSDGAATTLTEFLERRIGTKQVDAFLLWSSKPNRDDASKDDDSCEEYEEGPGTYLSKNQRQTIRAEIDNTPVGAAVVEIDTNSEVFGLLRRDIESLGPSQWLTDNAINGYLAMVMMRSRNQMQLPSVYALTTHFWQRLNSEANGADMRNWKPEDDIFGHDIILIPIHVHGNHWTLVCVDMRTKKLTYYDSLGEVDCDCIQKLWDCLEIEARRRNNIVLDFNEWDLSTYSDRRRQRDGSSCGIFVCQTAEYVSRDVAPNIEQQDIPNLREKMLYEIVTNQLI